jgi:hypothetical protein
MIDMYKKRKIEIMIDFELHAPNLLSTYILKKKLCRCYAHLNKSINYSLKF